MRRYGKYGNFTLKVPQYEQEKFVLQDQFDKGLIVQRKFNFEINKIKRDQLYFICRTNGGYTASVKRDNLTLSERKEHHTNQLLKEKKESSKLKLGEVIMDESVT